MSKSSAVRWLLPVLSGGLLVFGFPRWDFELAVWVWLVPLLTVLWTFPLTGPGRVRPFWAGYLAGAAFFIPNLHWIRHSSRVRFGAVDERWIGWGPELLGAGAVVGLALYCAVYFGLWGWFVARFARPDVEKISRGGWQVSTVESLRCALLAGAAWAGCEWLRSTTVFTGFGWNGLGVGMHANNTLIQAADLVGVLGLSFLPVFVACAGFNTLVRMVYLYQGRGTCRSRLDFTLALVVLLAAVGYGLLKNLAKPGETVKVRTLLIQPNISQVDAWSGRLAQDIYRRLEERTRLYAEARDGVNHMDLVIWPESALPVHLYGLPDHKPYFDNLLSSGDFSLLTGTEIYPPGAQRGHVSAVLFRGGYDNRQEHHKTHLVPFGEFLPLRSIPPFSFLQGVLPGDFEAGTSTEPLRLEKPRVDLIPLICFEDTVGRVARKFARPEPQIIVNISNDGWFLNSVETEVHLANAKFRAVELRRPMVRATNTGISCFIDPQGRVRDRLEDPDSHNTFIEGAIPGDVPVPVAGEMTFYARHGDVFCLSALALCVLAPLAGRLTRPRAASRFSSRKP